MAVRRSFLIALLVAVVAGGAYAGLSALAAAHQRSLSRAAALAARADAAAERQDELRASRLLHRLRLPPATRPHSPVAACLPNATTWCGYSTRKPSPAMAQMLSTLKAQGIEVTAPNCNNPATPGTPAFRSFRGGWAPCSEGISVQGTLLTVVAFPHHVHGVGLAGRLLFRGTDLSIDADYIGSAPSSRYECRSPTVANSGWRAVDPALFVGKPTPDGPYFASCGIRLLAR